MDMLRIVSNSLPGVKQASLEKLLFFLVTQCFFSCCPPPPHLSKCFFQSQLDAQSPRCFMKQESEGSIG